MCNKESITQDSDIVVGICEAVEEFVSDMTDGEFTLKNIDLVQNTPDYDTDECECCGCDKCMDEIFNDWLLELIDECVYAELALGGKDPEIVSAAMAIDRVKCALERMRGE